VRRSVTVLATLSLLGLGTLATAAPVLAAPCDGSGASVGNGGFETPPVAADSVNFFTTETAPWQTTDSNNQIEVWGDGFNGVPAAAGNAFAEINANSAGTLYQDVVSTPGATMSWTLAHRGRGGDDTMEVLIGDANVADVNGSAGWDYTSPNLTDGVTAWGTHGDDYVVPSGQTCTRFAFRAVSTGSGDDSIGNFLDEVSFIVTAPPEPPGPTTRVTPPPTDAIAAAVSGESGAPLLPIGLALLGMIAGLGVLVARTRPTRRDG
jgi:hypothetical protein